MPGIRTAIHVYFDASQEEYGDLPKMQQFIKGITDVGAIELCYLHSFNPRSPLPPLSGIKVNNRVLARILSCTRRKLFQTLRRAGFRKDWRHRSRSMAVSRWATRGDVFGAVHNLVGLTMLDQPRYAYAHLELGHPLVTSNMLVPRLSTYQRRRDLEHIWTTLDALRGYPELLGMLREQIAQDFAEIFSILELAE